MSDFITPDGLKTFGAAVAAVVAVVNLALMLAGERARPYAKWLAFGAALLATLAARGLPPTLPDGIALVFSAVYVFLAAMGGNIAVTDALAARQPQARGLYAAGAPRFWRKW